MRDMGLVWGRRSGLVADLRLRGIKGTGRNALVRELGKMEGLLGAARVVDRGVEVAGGGSGPTKDSPRAGSRLDNVAEVAQGQMAGESREVTPEQKWPESREVTQGRAVLTAEVAHAP